ncbi:polysaccharide deacetylase family protein [Halobium salinum]|uniref:Polysaccharide deacetylase family protein n=1 Tax=Halobium salinum TaxID=1364940 RepID=A0ABD5P9U2_9EURY|nr:polysaccharide deacetylase family protein [Halobium salinum]
MKAAMYHYVRPAFAETAPHGYYHLSFDDFRRQLDHLMETYGIVDREAFVEWLHSERPQPEGVVLTFDDGLADHHEWVHPELRARGLWGVFFVSTEPLSSSKALSVHRAHALLGAHGPERVHRTLRDVMEEQAIVVDDSITDGYDHRVGDDDASAVKQAVNYELPVDCVSEVLDAIEDRLGSSIDAGSYYANRTALRALSEAGHLLGAHTVSHLVLSRLSVERQRTEIAGSLDAVRDIAPTQPVSLFAYPFGGRETFSSETIRVLDALGCDAAFTTEPGDLPARTDRRWATLPRCDCNEFPHGSATFGFGRLESPADN